MRAEAGDPIKNRTGHGGFQLKTGAGGRRWWAHLAFTRINIQLTIGKKEVEETPLLRMCGGHLELRAFQGDEEGSGAWKPSGGGFTKPPSHRTRVPKSGQFVEVAEAALGPTRDHS
jgi:hypothetical protein